MSNETGADLEEGALTARRLIEWRNGGRSLAHAGEAAVLTHDLSLLPRRRPWSRRAASPFSFEVATVDEGVALVGLRGLGAPAAAIAIEELAVAGVRQIVVVDVAGSIDPAVRAGDAMLIDAAIAGDGTSPHYGVRGSLVSASLPLCDVLAGRVEAAGIQLRRGRVWTTDAVFRETPSLIAKYREQGAVLVDLETAAVLAVSAALGIEAAAVLVATDELNDRWRPPSDLRLIRELLRRLIHEAAACLRA